MAVDILPGLKAGILGIQMLNIRRARLFDTSPGIALACRSSQGAYAPSMSSHRLPGDQNISRCVFVSVQVLVAVLAIELANIQAKSSVNVTARITPLAAGKEPVSYPQLPPIPRAFVSQHLPEPTEAGATDVLRQIVILDHPTHVQVLNCQHVKPANQVSSEFVERVFPAVGNLGVQPCHLQPLVIPAATIFDATGKNPLQSSQPCGVAGCVTRISDSFPGGKRGQSRNSQVNPDLVSGLGERGFRWFVQAKTHEITSIPALCYRAGSYYTRECATPFNSETTDFRNCEVAICRIPFEPARMIFSGLFAVLGREFWVGRPFGEEIGERSLQMPQGLLLWDAGRLTQETKGRVVAVLRPSRAAGIVIDRLAVLETIRAKAQGEVIGVTDTSKLTRQLPLLAVCRVCPKSHANFHLQKDSLNCKIVKC